MHMIFARTIDCMEAVQVTLLQKRHDPFWMLSEDPPLESLSLRYHPLCILLLNT